MSSLTVHSPAKINTILRLTGSRPDGYHTLEMVMVPLKFGDTLTISSAPASEHRIHLTCSDPTLACDATNLCHRAAAALQPLMKTPQSVTMHVEKCIPMGGGLGGGSGNAATVLSALNKMWGLGLSNPALGELGVRLGADVPFFCHGVPAFCEGIGEIITPLTRFPKLSILLVNPGFHLSTPSIYKAYDLRRQQQELRAKGGFASPEHSTISGERGQEPPICLTPPKARGSCPKLFEGLQEVAATLENDLQFVAEKIHPIIGNIRNELIEQGAVAAQMSGSGPTVFGIFETEAKAQQAAQKIAQPGWKVVVTETRAS